MKSFLKSQKAIYGAVILIALMGFVISFKVIPRIYAATLLSSNVTISDSRPSQTGVTYTFQFVIGSTAGIKNISFAFCQAASGTCTAPLGLSTTASTLGSTSGISGSTLTINASTAGTPMVNIGTTASQTIGATGSVAINAVVNPSSANTTSYVRITTTDTTGATIDSSTVAFATLTTTSMTFSASVDPNFTFSVAGLSAGATIGGNAVATITSSANSAPFGTLTVGATALAAHDVTVTTNAAKGYQVTVKSTASNPLSNTNGDVFSPFTGSNATPTVWSSPNGSVQNTNTGFFGYTTNDSTLCTGTAARFTSSGPKWAGPSTTASEVACTTSTLSSGTETVRLGWAIEANTLQAPGSYAGTMILVATPTY